MGMYMVMNPCGMLVLPLNNLYWRRIGMEGGRRGTMVWRSEGLERCFWDIGAHGGLGRLFICININGDSMIFCYTDRKLLSSFCMFPERAAYYNGFCPLHPRRLSFIMFRD